MIRKRQLHVIVPMAGEGSRFVSAGYLCPKPLIKFNDQYLFQQALSCVEPLKDYIRSYTFLVRSEHIDRFHIDELIKEVYPDAYIIALEQTTQGAAETAFIGIKNLIVSGVAAFNDSIVVLDCDVIVKSNNWVNAIIKNLKSKSNDGMLLTFESDNDRYSYALSNKGIVKEVAEKKVISNTAITSPYYITTLSDFIDGYKYIEQRGPNSFSPQYKELYMSSVFEYMIKAEKKIKAVPVDVHLSLGTPEELKEAQEKDI